MTDNNEKLTQAIGNITKESTEIISNSLTTFLTRVQSAKAKEMLTSLEIDVSGSEHEILNALSAKWRNIGEEDQIDIGILIGGKYHLSRFIILMYQLSLDK